MKQIILFSILVLFFPFTVQASDYWYFPVSQFTTRQSYKSFGQYIDKNFYIGKTDLFPNQFIGYHAAIDLEIFPGELNLSVPVYAVADGKVVYAAPVSGYGGLILLQLTGTGDTALYGHVKLINLPFKVGDMVVAGTRLTYLGDAFSSQTGGERKHLHFGIYKGTDLYFRGYEPTPAALNFRWLNPTDFLTSHSAIDSLAPSPSQTPSVSPIQPTRNPTPSKSFFQIFISFLMNLFGHQ